MTSCLNMHQISSTVYLFKDRFVLTTPLKTFHCSKFELSRWREQERLIPNDIGNREMVSDIDLLIRYKTDRGWWNMIVPLSEITDIYEEEK